MLGLAVVLLLFLVGYPLLWLMLGALGLPQSFGIEHLQRAFTRPQNYSPWSIRCSLRSAPAS